MTGFGDVTIGRLVLREALTAASEKTDDAGNATVSISGQESSTGRSRAELAAVQDDIRGLAGRLVPVTWTDKSGRNGYYMVSGPSAELMDWQGELITLAWSMSLARVGSDSEVDLESQLSGPLTRTNGYSVTGERWQAPPVGHSSYWSGATAPSTMTRTGADGAMTIYRGVPLGVNTRYACPVESYGGGRVRIIDSLLMERTGTDFPLDPLGWEINNALTRVRWDAAGLKVASWDAGTSVWEPKTFLVNLGGVDLHMPDAVTALRNEYEAATVRLLWTRSPVGRATVDITLRRGAWVAEFYAQSLPAATVTVALEIPEPTSSATGYIVASTNDSNGNRFLLGSVGTFTANTTLSSISKTSTAAMDFCIGMVVGGSGAVTGDGAAALYQQMLGSAGESVRATRR